MLFARFFLIWNSNWLEELWESTFLTFTSVIFRISNLKYYLLLTSLHSNDIPYAYQRHLWISFWDENLEYVPSLAGQGRKRCNVETSTKANGRVHWQAMQRLQSWDKILSTTSMALGVGVAWRRLWAGSTLCPSSRVLIYTNEKGGKICLNLESH